MTGRTLAIVEAGVTAAILPAADVLLQAIMASGFDAIDLKQVGAAAAVGGLTYLIGFLRALPLAPSGQPLATTAPLLGMWMGSTAVNGAPMVFGSTQPPLPPDAPPHG